MHYRNMTVCFICIYFIVFISFYFISYVLTFSRGLNIILISETFSYIFEKVQLANLIKLVVQLNRIQPLACLVAPNLVRVNSGSKSSVIYLFRLLHSCSITQVVPQSTSHFEELLPLAQLKLYRIYFHRH